jgi:hypothetical protein
MYGIKWKADYVPVNILMMNESDMDYSNYEVYITTNQSIADVGVDAGRNKCMADVKTPHLEIASPTLSFIGEDGKVITRPIALSKQGKFYLIQCDKLGTHSKIDVVLAVIREDPFAKLAWAALSARYVADNRARVYPAEQCFLASCADNPPKSLNDVFD